MTDVGDLSRGALIGWAALIVALGVVVGWMPFARNAFGVLVWAEWPVGFFSALVVVVLYNVVGNMLPIRRLGRRTLGLTLRGPDRPAAFVFAGAVLGLTTFGAWHLAAAGVLPGPAGPVTLPLLAFLTLLGGPPHEIAAGAVIVLLERARIRQWAILAVVATYRAASYVHLGVAGVVATVVWSLVFAGSFIMTRSVVPLIGAQLAVGVILLAEI